MTSRLSDEELDKLRGMYYAMLRSNRSVERSAYQIFLQSLLRHFPALLEEITRLREGYVMVPREPTDAMLEAMALAYENSGFHDLIGPMSSVYKSMLQASPQPAGGENKTQGGGG